MEKERKKAKKRTCGTAQHKKIENERGTCKLKNSTNLYFKDINGTSRFTWNVPSMIYSGVQYNLQSNLNSKN